MYPLRKFSCINTTSLAYICTVLFGYTIIRKILICSHIHDSYDLGFGVSFVFDEIQFRYAFSMAEIYKIDLLNNA